MDALLTLPLITFFFPPSSPSWSTSLNVLFFSLTWSSLVLSHPPLYIHIFGLLAIRVVFYLLPALVFLAFDTLLPSLAQGVKFGGGGGLPPRDGKVLLGRILPLCLLNLVLEALVEGGTSTIVSAGFMGGEPVFMTKSTLPMPWEAVKHVAAVLVAREGLTWFLHCKILHSSSRRARGGGGLLERLRTRLTSLHRTHSHHYAPPPPNPPYSLLLFADHPLPFLLHRFLPRYLPSLLLSLLLRHRSHSTTSTSSTPIAAAANIFFTTTPANNNDGGHLHLLNYLLLALLTTIEETVAMSGYDVSFPGVFMRGMARRCAGHYSGGGSGEYGCWGVADWVAGTGGVGVAEVGEVVGKRGKGTGRKKGRR